MFGKIVTIPVIVVLVDIWYGLVLNVMQSLQAPQATAPSVLPTVPDVAFNWLQVGVNASMVLVISLALLQLLRFHAHVTQHSKPNVLKPFQSLGLVLTLAFGLPALYGLMMTVWQALQGHWMVSVGDLRYLMVAVCMSWCAGLCVWCLGIYLRKRHKKSAQTDH